MWIQLKNVLLVTVLLSTILLTGCEDLEGLVTEQVTHSLNNVSFHMRLVPGSRFRELEFEQPPKRIVDGDYWIAETPVTYALWYEVITWATGNGYVFGNPGREGNNSVTGLAPTDRQTEPVTTVSWLDCVVWLNALTEYYNLLHGTEYTRVYYDGDDIIKDSKNLLAYDSLVEKPATTGFRLLTRDEWEIAARYLGPSKPTDHPLNLQVIKRRGFYWLPQNYVTGATDFYTNEGAMAAVSWYKVNSNSRTQAVGQKPINDSVLGLYDMSGNVSEWVNSPSVSANSNMRPFMGGSWTSDAFRLRVDRMSFRSGPNSTTGLRIGRTP